MIKDEVLALCEISNDLLYHKIPNEKLAYYIKESLEIGRKTAKEFLKRDILDLCEENKIMIEYIRESKKTYGVSYRAQVEMDKRHTKICLYEGSIRELAKNSGYEGRKALTYEEALKIHLGHEFFHYLEYTNKDFVPDRLEEIVTMRLLTFKRKARIQRCSEVAAHAFAKELLGLKELPNVYDYIYLVNSGKMKRDYFAGMLKEKEAKTKEINL